MHKVRTIAVAAVWLLSAACRGLDVGMEGPTEQALTPVAVATDAPAPTQAPEAATTVPEPTSAPAAEQHPLAGLVYTIGAGNGLWRVGADGQAELLTDQHYPTLSPDQSRVLYAVGYEGDIWLKKLPDGVGTNLTNTPDRDENAFWWWPANPGLVVFSSRTEAEGPFATTLGFVRLDGSGYQLLEGTSPSVSPPSLSPDGQTIAYERSAEPWLYRLNGGAERLDLGGFGQDFDKATYPTWSPNGQYLAWKVYGNGQSAVAVMDVAAGTTRLLHLYTLQGGSEIYAELAWSPDSQWLAVVNQAELAGERTSLWALRADGSAEQYLGPLASAPVWSPDSQALVFTQLPADGGAFDTSMVKRVRVGAWAAEALELPGGAQVMQWVEVR